MKTLKNDLQSQIKQEIKTLSNDEIVTRFKAMKLEQQDTMSVSLAMALAQVITVLKREITDRGLDYHTV